MTDLIITPNLDLDPLMRRAFSDYRDDPLTVRMSGGIIKTEGTKEWLNTNDVQQNSGFRVGRQWKLDIAPDTVLQLDVDRIPDAEVDDSPRWLWLSTEARFTSITLTPEQCWALQPRGQSVTGGGTFDLQFPKLAQRYRAKGLALRIGAVALAGHQAAIEHVHAINYGALGDENFIFYIQAAFGMYDRDLISELDPLTHIFDADTPDDQCSHILGTSVSQYAAADSDTQVTCNFIAGSVGQRANGQWQQHRRAFAYASRASGTILDPTPNRVQLVTLYQTLRGRVDNCASEGMSVGYYGDTYSSKGVDLLSNSFLRCRYHGVQLVLSPGGVCPEQYSHEGYTIDGSNTITSEGSNVLLDTVGPVTDARYIRQIAVDAKFSLENRGATDVTRTGVPVPPATRKGCNPFRRG